MQWMIGALALTGCTGPDNTLAKVYPTLAVFPEVLDFGEVAQHYSLQGTLTLANAATVDLAIDDITIEGDTDGAFTIDSAPTTVEAGESAEIKVSCTPPQLTTYPATLSIYSNVEEQFNPTPVTLTCTGSDLPAPDIELDTLSMDFGIVATNATLADWIEVRNVGDGPLTIADQVPSGSGAFTVGLDLGGVVINPDALQLVPVTYTPTNEEGDHGAITFTSDDPDEPSVQVILLGNGGGPDFEYPVADILCPTSVAPRDIVTLDGRGSYDPAGNTPLTYEWTVTAVPDGSTAIETFTPATDIGYLQTDLAGTYIVTLQVENAVGLRSVPATCVMDAIPEEQLHVELTWNGGGADLDLHLLNGAGTFYTNPDDCNWCNRTPDWGVVLDTTDDPRLDIDDQFGYGPENINLDDPADDTYEVKVHYFIENGDEDVTATVHIYVFGTEEYTFSKVMERNDVWDVAQIRWPDGAVIEESTALWDTPVRMCN